MKTISDFSYLILILSAVFTSCIGNVVYEQKLSGNYELSANDHMSGMSIYGTDDGYQIGVINATVFSVGFNEDFIIVKQHPYENDLINKTITNYYIICIEEKMNVSSIEHELIIYDKEGFLEKRQELGIPDSLKFTIVFNDLE